MKLCLKQKGFSEFFNAIRNVYKYLNILKKKDDPHRLCISEISDCERRGYLNV